MLYSFAIAQQTKGDNSSQTSFSKTGGTVNGWYKPIEFIKNNTNGPFTDSVSLVFPDTTLVFVDKNNKKNLVSSHAWGHSYDLRHYGWEAVPSDPNFPIQVFDKKDSYIWDSLAFKYIYRRNNADINIVDTCFVTYYKNSISQQIDQGIIIWGSGDTMGNASPHGLDKKTLAGTRFFGMDTILLTAKETTILTANGWGSSYKVLHVGTFIEGSKGSDIKSLFSATITYKPGHKWNVGDTVESRGTQQPKNGINYFGYTYTTIKEVDGGLPIILKSRSFADNSLLLTSDPKIANWNGFMTTNILPSPIFANVQAFVSGTTGGPYWGIEELGVSLGRLYPNPAREGQSVFIEYSVKKTTTISIKVFDMLGKKVATVLGNKKIEAGEHQAKATLNLEAGIYFYTLSTGNTVVSSKKFTIIR